MTNSFLKIGSELAKVRNDFRSELTKVQTKVRSKFTHVRIEIRSEDFLKTMFRHFHLGISSKILKRIRIDIEINVLLLFCFFFVFFFQFISVLLFNGYSEDIFSHKLWLG